MNSFLLSLVLFLPQSQKPVTAKPPLHVSLVEPIVYATFPMNTSWVNGSDGKARGCPEQPHVKMYVRREAKDSQDLFVAPTGVAQVVSNGTINFTIACLKVE